MGAAAIVTVGVVAVMLPWFMTVAVAVVVVLLMFLLVVVVVLNDDVAFDAGVTAM